MGGRGRRPVAARTGWPAWSPVPTAPRLPGMSPVEEAVADLWATGVSPDGHPTQFLRQQLDEARRGHVDGVCGTSTPGSRVTVAGVVTHRQRPMTAQGTTFLNLEDETGLINVVVSKGCWARFRRVAREAPAMPIRGRLERGEGVINVVAEHLDPLDPPGQHDPRQPRLPLTIHPSVGVRGVRAPNTRTAVEHSDAVDFGSRRSSVGVHQLRG